MQLPRRVPWTSFSEVEQLCSWIYDEKGTDYRMLAVHRLSAWKCITQLPHALDSTLSFLTVSIADNSLKAPDSFLSLRQSYSSAVIRFVNGLVDPLQIGAFARSIASIAIQLHIPLWLVELRHAATHEDLPSIEILRNAVKESLVWILHNYFLPVLNLSTTSVQPELRPFTPILHQYQSLLEVITKDVSLRSTYKDIFSSIMKDVELWISEAKVAAKVVAGDLTLATRFQGIKTEDMNEQDNWALEKVCDAMLQTGALVPYSLKKRDFPLDVFHPSESSVMLWAPLIEKLQSFQPSFIGVLVERIISMLTRYPDVTDCGGESQVDVSCEMYLARWAFWLLETGSEETDGPNTLGDLDKLVITLLLQSLGYVLANSREDRVAAMELLDQLCYRTPELRIFLSTIKTTFDSKETAIWQDSNLLVMNRRLETLLSSAPTTNTNHSADFQVSSSCRAQNNQSSHWRLLTQLNGWRPCPIGVHCT